MIPYSVIYTQTPDPVTLNFKDPAKVPENLQKADAVNTAMRQMNPVIGLTNKTPPPNLSINLQGGDSVEIGPYEQVGVIGAFSYRNKYSFYDNGQRGNLVFQQGTNNTYVADPQLFQQSQGKQEVLWGGLVGISGQWERDQKASMNLMYNLGSDDNATQRVDPGTTSTEYQQIISYGERSLAYLQVLGEDRIASLRNMKVNWNGGLGQASLQEPDQRQFQYGLLGDGTYVDLTTPGDGGPESINK